MASSGAAFYGATGESPRFGLYSALATLKRLIKAFNRRGWSVICSSLLEAVDRYLIGSRQTFKAAIIIRRSASENFIHAPSIWNLTAIIRHRITALPGDMSRVSAYDRIAARASAANSARITRRYEASASHMPHNDARCSACLHSVP